MPKQERFKTDYPGVFYVIGKRLGKPGPEKIFYIVFKKDGKIIEEKAGRQFADEMTASKASRIRGERIEGKRQSPGEIRGIEKAKKEAEANRQTIDRLWTKYKESRTLKGLKQDENRYEIYIKPAFGDKEVPEITPLDVDRLRINLLKGKTTLPDGRGKKGRKSPQTVKHCLVLLRRIILFGASKNLCPPLHFKIELPKVDNEKTEDLSPEQLKKLMEAIEADEDWQAKGIMKMALFTGMRKGEIFRLEWPDINFERSVIRIRGPKGGKDQTIPLNAAAREVLEGLPRPAEDAPNEDYELPLIFPGKGGRPHHDIKRAVERIRKRADLPLDFRPLHGLRHHYASMLASSGQVDMHVLQKLLTHKSPAMTQRYAHLRDEALQRAASVADNLFSDALRKPEGKKSA